MVRELTAARLFRRKASSTTLDLRVRAAFEPVQQTFLQPMRFPGSGALKTHALFWSRSTDVTNAVEDRALSIVTDLLVKRETDSATSPSSGRVPSGIHLRLSTRVAVLNKIGLGSIKSRSETGP